ncbi:hypothetical protein TCAL_02083 [Tigriopus californicus]|uniref:Orn/DAP/Arg decarboxylase 2 N-terminal domain-containing protein n=1 Tax=Tigriopus californicus TaxID=6832 RepID=A0A553NCP0_TIGCA|nr:hypothetical protein TCAL_02083 [Tigriopus californicus]
MGITVRALSHLVLRQPRPRMDEILKIIAAKGLINDATPSAEIFDLDYFQSRLDSLQAAFPEPFIVNAAALKANSFRGILNRVKAQGFGAECASISETMHAISLGFSPEAVIFDSPCKTKLDLKTALDAGVYINLDNEHEMAIVDELLKDGCSGSKAKLGLRINPVVGGGTIAIISTATKQSKFGLPLIPTTKERILDLYEKYSWLSGIHIHVGSQGVPLELFVKGARVCMDLVKEIESKCKRQLEIIDIGGGLSSTYEEAEEPKSFEYGRYRDNLNQVVPELFSGQYKVITEFGRSLFLKAGFSVTRVDFIKDWVPEIKPIVLTHVGTNQFIRETYLPEVWRHRYLLADPEGNLKSPDQSGSQVYDLAGPMCFQGDYLAKDVELPKIDMGDWLIIQDTGAYTMAMYSRFNSILPSPVYGFTKKNGQMTILQQIAQNDLINDEVSCLDVIDFETVKKRILDYDEAFPEEFISNAYCVKVNPFVGVLNHVLSMGMGAECGSWQEVFLALKTGFKPEDIFYYSPVRTKSEFKQALESGVNINLDNWQDLAHVDEQADLNGIPKSYIGLRINPIIGFGTIVSTSTATKASKFGIPITEDICHIYQKYSWLNSIHLHVGSQGIPVINMVEATRKLMDLVMKIEAQTGKKLLAINIGGGLSSSYDTDQEPPEMSFATYRKALEKSVPELLSGDRKIITEFGRCLILKAGFSLTRIEAIKSWFPDINPILLTHFGANQFPWEVYMPGVYRHRFSLAKPNGQLQFGDQEIYDIAGPLCFQGDYLAREIALPKANPGDWLIVRDTGAYTKSMFGRFHSTRSGPVYAVTKSSTNHEVIVLTCIKSPENSEEVIKFWETPEIEGLRAGFVAAGQK